MINNAKESQIEVYFMFKLIKFILKLIFFIIIIAAITFVYSRYIEPHMLLTKEVVVQSHNQVKLSKDLKIVVFADTHFGDYYTLKDFKKTTEAINDIKPDMVIFAGDLIDHFNLYTGDISEISRELGGIKAPYGKYAIFGNHDYGGGAENEYQDIMESGGFTVLKNEYYPLDELGVAIIGIDDVVIGYGKSDIVSWGRPDYYNIVLSHAPDVIDEVLNYNTDLMISAHTHGRQINLKFFDQYILPPYGKKYVKGLYSFENGRRSQLYVNSGVGMTKLPYRFLSPPEVTKLIIKK